MRLFKITQEWEGNSPKWDERIPLIQNGEEGPGLYVGAFFLPIAKKLSSALLPEELEAGVRLVAAGVNEGADGNPTRLFPAPKGEQEQVRRSMLAEQLEARGGWEEARRVRRVGGRSEDYYGPCLAHIHLQSQSPVVYYASTYDELEVPLQPCARVERQYHSFSKAVGIRILVLNEGGEGLLELLPGSSFRLHQEEPMSVRWTGKHMQVYKRVANYRPKASRHPRPSKFNDVRAAAGP